MNRFKTTDLGGLGVRLDDFRFIDSSIRDAIFGGLSFLGDLENSVIILSGCETVVTTTSVNVTDGYVLINGEICKVESHGYSISTPGVRYWDIESTFDPSGTKIFKNGTSHETYEIRKAKTFFSLVLPPGKIAFSNTKRFYTELKNGLGLNNLWSLLPSCSNDFPGPYGVGKYMIDGNGFVHLKGAFTSEDPGTNTLIGVLPAGFRPPEPHYSLLPTPGAGSNFEIIIQTNGNIVVESDCPQSIYLNQIPAFKV